MDSKCLIEDQPMANTDTRIHNRSKSITGRDKKQPMPTGSVLISINIIILDIKYRSQIIAIINR